MSLGQHQTRGRRRRVLNEEILGTGDSTRGTNDPPVEGARYTDAASIENHAQITDFVPRKIRTYALLLVVGIGAVAGLVVLHERTSAIAATIGTGPIGAFDMASPGSLASWFAVSTLAVCAVVAVLVYSLRRHRVDDYRARYRVWVTLAFACIVLSINASASLHTAWSQAMAHVTGWSALPNDAIWWVVPLGLLATWVGFRTGRDLAERAASVLAFLLALTCYAVALGAHFGWISTTLVEFPVASIVATSLVGHLLLLFSITWYARYVVLDVQGLIEHRVKDNDVAGQPVQDHTGRARRTRTAGTSKSTPSAASTKSQKSSARKRRSRANNPDSHRTASATEWVDGSESEMDAYDDEPRQRKLSKAERKRLRKQNIRNRAA